MDAETLKAQGWQMVGMDGFSSLVGPFWMITENSRRRLGVQIEARHCNGHLGTIHGGMVMTFADLALGIGVSDALNGNRNCSTISLNTQFLNPVHAGEFLYCYPEVTRTSKSVIFVRGLLETKDRVVASVEGIWKVIDQSRIKPINVTGAES